MDLKTLVFAGPSAVGKTYLAERIISLYPNKFEQARLYTTRKARKNEVSTDRIFITEEEFKNMVRSKKFVVYDNFANNWYGFTKESLYPKDKHLLVNVWPWLIPQFSKLDHAIIVGMQVEDNWEQLLESRMEQRGDNEQTIRIRKELIKKDKADLEKHKKTAFSHGNMFVINNNQTIPKKILPWIENKLGLKT